MNNVSVAPVPAWTDLSLLDYWVNWGPLCTKSQLTFGSLSQFIHLPYLNEERHNPFLNKISEASEPVFSTEAYNCLHFWLLLTIKASILGVYNSSPGGKSPQCARFHHSKSGVVHQWITVLFKQFKITDLCKSYHDSPHGHHQSSGGFS